MILNTSHVSGRGARLKIISKPVTYSGSLLVVRCQVESDTTPSLPRTLNLYSYIDMGH